MKKIIILIAFGFGMGSYAQTPPQPNLQSSTTREQVKPCVGTYDDDGNYIPPPPGLCMPIDDYVVYLLIAGAVYGAYRSHRLRDV